MGLIDFLRMDSGRSSTEESIVFILSENHPLTAKAVYSLVKRISARDLTYQAVHKKLQEMVAENKLVKNENGYELSKSWLSNQKRFFDRMNAQYADDPLYEISRDFKSPVHWTFHDLTTMCLTLANIFDRNTFTEKEFKPFVCVLNHFWWPPRFNFSDYEICLSFGRNCKPWFLGRKNSPFDKWIKKYYDLAGFSGSKLGASFEGESEFCVQGDVVAQVDYSPEAKELTEQLYARVHNVYDLFNEYIQKTYSNKSVETYVTFTRNPSLAKILRERIMSEFRK